MKRSLILCLITTVCASVAFAQASGNVGYSQSGSNARADANERNKRTLAKEDAPPNATSMFIDASVLMNVKADEYVALFGVTQECNTVAECNQKMDATVNEFAGELKRLGT